MNRIYSLIFKKEKTGLECMKCFNLLNLFFIKSEENDIVICNDCLERVKGQ